MEKKLYVWRYNGSEVGLAKADSKEDVVTRVKVSRGNCKTEGVTIYVNEVEDYMFDYYGILTL
jgi:hypothetical protein